MYNKKRLGIKYQIDARATTYLKYPINTESILISMQSPSVDQL